jgi:putative hydrolase of the HAD superfamily
MIPVEMGTSMRPQAAWDGIVGIVFDAVGTLIRPVPSVAEAYTATAVRQGVSLEPDVVRVRFQAQFASDEVRGDAGALSTDEATERRRWEKIVIGVLPEVPDLDRAFEELWEHFSKPGSWRCFADVGPALRALRAEGLAVSIGSNFDGRLRSVVQGLPDLAECVDSLVISSEIGFRKPHPSFYHAACSRMGFAPPQVLCVGDDLENDVRGAIRAGLSGLLLDRTLRAPDDLPHVPNLTALVQSKLCSEMKSPGAC